VRRRKLACLVCASAGTLAVAACGTSGSANSSSGAVIQAKVSISQVAGTAMYNSAVKFGELLSQYTDGRVTVKVYPNSELGSSASILQGCESGTIAVCAEAGLSTANDAVQVPQTAYMFPSYAVMQAATNSAPVLAAFQPAFAKVGLSFMGFWGVGPSDIFTTSTAVTTPTNLRGLRLRVANAYLGALQYSPLGADPVTLSSDQITTALSTHLIDGMDEPITTVTSAGWSAEMHNLTLTQDAFIQTPVAVSEKFLNELPATDRPAVEKAFLQTLSLNLSESNADAAAALKKLESDGFNVIHPDVNTFKAAEAEVLQKVEAKYPTITKLMLDQIKSPQAGS
jgi:TRAP-type C4-dicarboxylate transport system substrate-binding protein